MVKIKGKLFRVGHSYAIRVKKALVDAEVLNEGQNYEFDLCDPNPVAGKENAVYGTINALIHQKKQEVAI